MSLHDPDFTSVEEFAQRTSLSARSIWRLVAAGRLPSLSVGRRRLIPLAEGIDALRLSQNDEKGGSAPSRSSKSEINHGELSPEEGVEL